jgi:hypothetical protein
MPFAHLTLQGHPDNNHKKRQPPSKMQASEKKQRNRGTINKKAIDTTDRMGDRPQCQPKHKLRSDPILSGPSQLTPEPPENSETAFAEVQVPHPKEPGSSGTKQADDDTHNTSGTASPLIPSKVNRS